MKLVFMLSIAWKATSLLQAQQLPMPDELRSFIQQANANYPQLKQQQLQLQAGDVRVEIAQSAKRPNVQLTGSYTYVTPVSGITPPLNGREIPLKFAPTQSVNGYVSVNQPICDFERTEALIRLASDNAQILQHNYELAQQTLAYQVAAVYYGIGFLQQGIAVQDSVIKTAGATVKVLSTRLQNGDALQYDVFSQQVRMKIAVNRKVELQNQLDRQLAALTYLTGSACRITTQPIQQLLDQSQTALEQGIDVEGQIKRAKLANKDMLLAQGRVKVAETDALVSQRSSGLMLTISSLAGIRNGYAPAVDQLRPNLAVSLNATVPIYAGNQYTLKNRVAELNVKASQYAVDEVQAQLHQRLTQLQADSRSNQARLANLDTQVLQAREALAMANVRFRNGLITTAELQSAQTSVEEAELVRLNFRYQLLLNRLELKRLLGEPLL
ncbi:TolC family protein [Spirosoma foliorum]|uniref:TolC family protein n=1 Tax=Spirosoma foliorum TaxID=2710596 RepID=A0A7G5GRE7_9BACT|nr:TolC family protein [Spirosoma foliorum]QMW01439.1 TolC family protein [Spirosoma foliorum]